MRRVLKPAPLEGAREPTALLVREDWIWRGQQFLDGIYVARTGDQAEDWRASAADYLPLAGSIIETDDAAIILFDEAQTVDCSMLGAALPLRRLHGALSSFPFKTPQNDRLAAAIGDTLLIVHQGAVRKTELSRFRQADLANWYDVSEVVIETGVAPSRRPGVPDVTPLKMSREHLFEQTYFDAGLRDVREAVGRVPDKIRWSEVVRRFGGPLVIALFAVALGVAVLSGLIPASKLLAPVVATFSALVAFTLYRMLAIRRSAQTRQGQAKASSTSPNKRASSNIPIIIVAVVALFTAVLRSNSSGGGLTGILAGAMVVLAVVWLFYRVGGRFGITGSSAAAASKSADANESGSAPQRDAGFLRRFFEKLLQNTPLADLALRKYDRRVAELRRLFAEGRLEEALKKSLALGEPPPPDMNVHADAPIAGPGIRKRLEIQATQAKPNSALAALPVGAREELEVLYRAHAEKCVANGDFEHAAFILSELLNDAEAAVKVFADAGKFSIAARLAQGRRLSPSLFIPLWYRAGEHERALRLAERHDAYDLLLRSTDESQEAFRGLIRRAWSERLAAVGDYVTALAVSEPLAGEDDALQARRQDWMAEGLVAANIDGAIIARALKALRAASDGAADPAMAAVERLLQDHSIEAARQRKHLAELLLEPGFEPGIVEAYRDQRLPHVADQLTRALLVDHAEFGLLSSRDLLSSLADAGGQTTLAADIRRLPKVLKTQLVDAPRRFIVGPKSGAMGVVACAPMRGKRLLAAYEDGSLRLFNSRNAEIWRDQLWNPRDIVPIAPGRLAIVIREEPNERRLSIVDTETLRYADIGPLDLQAWATTAARYGWLVYADNQVLNLRLDQFLAPLSGGTVETLEYHWATPITIDGRMLGLRFANESGDALWLFERTDGVLERWRVARNDLRTTYYALSFPVAARTPTLTSDFTTFEFVSKTGKRERLVPSFVTHDRGTTSEQAFPPIHVRTGNRRPSQHHCLPMAVAEAHGPAMALLRPSDRTALEISFNGAKDIAMRDSFSGDTVVLWDDAGRMVKLLTDNAEAQSFNGPLTETSATKPSE